MTCIPISRPLLNHNERKYVDEALDSGWVSSLGEYISRFENDFASFCGVKHAIAVCNGTVAIHLALESLGIGPGDEVIIPDLTFVATGNAVKYTGATPVIVDISPSNFCMDPHCFEAAITKRTKAVIPVHLYGCPANMPEITKIAKAHNLFVVEDAAEAHGAMIHGKKVGAWGDIGTFSFYGNKIITTGEGGMLTTNDSMLNNRIRFLRDHAMSKEKAYWHTELGYNYRMTNIQAALGVAQLEQIEYFIDERKKILSYYQKYLAHEDASIYPPLNSPDYVSVCWMVCLLYKRWTETTRNTFVSMLKQHDFDGRPFFYPLSDLPMFSNLHKTPVAHEVYLYGINLPCFVGLSEESIQSICDFINKNL